MISENMKAFQYQHGMETREYIAFDSTISRDGHAGETFDFCISNPPFGTPWKEDLKKRGLDEKEKKKFTDSRFSVVDGEGKELSFIPSFVNAAKNSNRETAMQQCASSLMMIVAGMLNENTEFCRYYLDHPYFMNAVNQGVFDAVYSQLGKLQSVEEDREVRYGGMSPKDWIRIIRDYTPMVREASKTKEIPLYMPKAADDGNTPG
jgi:hypothetical protein